MTEPDPSKRVLTTGEVAKLCCVAPRTVSKWFDSGKLRGYRIPGGKDRRIPLNQLISFMRAHGIPLNGLNDDKRRVVLLADDRSFADALETGLRQRGGYEVLVADSAFEAGALVHAHRPRVLIVDVARADVQPRDIRRYLRATPALRDLRVIGMGRALTHHNGQALLQAGLDGFVSKPFDIHALVDLIHGTPSSPIASSAV